jgi:hypothetical protein
MYEADDVTTATNRALARWAGLPLSTSGGRWFVPARYADKIEAWEAWMAAIGCHTSTWRIFVSPANMAELETTARDGLEERLHRLQDELASYATSDRTKIGTLEDRVAQFDDLRNTTELYERLLGQTMTELRGRLESAASALNETVTGRRAERDTARARKQAERNVARKAERARAKAAPLPCSRTAADLLADVLGKLRDDPEADHRDRLAAAAYVQAQWQATCRADSAGCGIVLPIPADADGATAEEGAIVVADALEIAASIATTEGVAELVDEIVALRTQLVALFPAAA